jgi:hypothetical protein
MELGKQKIAQMSVAVMGSAWRNLTFKKLTTDEGLVGVSEVRLSNRTNALLDYLEECKKLGVVGISDKTLAHAPVRAVLLLAVAFR